jgi:hypothetical protein
MGEARRVRFAQVYAYVKHGIREPAEVAAKRTLDWIELNARETDPIAGVLITSDQARQLAAKLRKERQAKPKPARKSTRLTYATDSDGIARLVEA